MLLTHVEEHPVRILHTEGMAVHAILFRLTVLDDGRLLVVGEASLVDTHLSPEFIPRLNETIGYVGIDGIG